MTVAGSHISGSRIRGCSGEDIRLPRAGGIGNTRVGISISRIALRFREAMGRYFDNGEPVKLESRAENR